MVKNAITVFARVKPEKSRKEIANYEIHRRPKKHLNEDFLVLTAPQKYGEYIDNRPESWNFSIFGHDVPQVDVFESVARPVVDSVFDGYNATIFAYGQTGSGKTYTITGEPEIHSERGILPRTLQYVFDIVRKNPENLYTVEVAYLEIYNENGYDLLLERKEREAATRLEDLPRVTIQEDESGTMHLKNLSFRIVQNEKEALQFLLDGDTYRAVSETPMNPRSSRSHCIFTVVVSVKKFGAERYSRAKMHLVDLAGSERVYKCAIQGMILTEAKYINLSLHFLEQVIVCLGQDNVSHVPYRNSLLTSVLRDSLGGNCITTMLATLSVSNFNLEETISTCRFAQRVALVKNDVNLSFELDTNSENILLRLENERLRKQIEDFKRQNICEVSSSGSVEYFKNLVVQRDQEISHLIDLLKKERSRRKSTVKEVPKAIREILQEEKYTQFPSNRSPRLIDQFYPTQSKTKQKNAISLMEKIQMSPRNKSQSPEVTRKIISLSQSTESQVSAIEVPSLNLEEENDLDVRPDRPQVESITPKVETISINTATKTKNGKMKKLAKSNTDRNIQMTKVAELNIIDDNQLLKFDNLKQPAKVQEISQIDSSIAESNYSRNNMSQSIEPSNVIIDREAQTPKTEKCYVKVIDNNESIKAKLVKPPPVDQEKDKMYINISGSDNRAKKTQAIVSLIGKTERDIRTSKKALFCAKDAENNGSGMIRLKESSPGKNTPTETEALGLEFPQNVMKMLRTSRNRLTDERNESSSSYFKPESPPSGFKTPNILRNTSCIEKHSMGGSVGRAQDKRLSNTTENNSDANIDNIVRIPLPLTGDPDIDEEIIAFYKAKQSGHLY